MLDRIEQARVTSKIDIRTGIQKTRIHPEDIEKTAFTTKYGQYGDNVMSMGLCIAPATCQALTDFIFRDLIDDLLVYLDDRLVFSNSDEEHGKHVKLVLEQLKENELYVSPKKCLLLQDEAEFLEFWMERRKS